MPSPTPPTQQMGELHEIYLAEVNAGRKSKASGSQWTDPADGRSAHDEPYALAWDGKATLGKQIAVTLDMVRKIREQALGEIPEIGLRWYANASLRDVTEDWIAVPGDDWREILASARSWRSLVEWLLEDPPDESLRVADEEDVEVFLRAAVAGHARLTASLAEAHGGLLAAGQRIAAQDLEIQSLREQAQGSNPAAEALKVVPKLPWGVVRLLPKANAIGSPGDAVATVTEYSAEGLLSTWRASSVRVDRSMDNHPKVFVNDMVVRNADVYDAEGRLLARVCRDDPSIEVG